MGQSDGAAYVVTELLEGGTLRTRLMGSVLPLRKAIDYGVQAARGLSAAHAKGITHRDIKPGNLFVTNDSFVKILDFGLAKMARSAAAEATSAPTATLDTPPGVVMGMVGYMSPEQVRGEGVNHRSDVFSLGVVVYEMLAGKRAFAGKSSVETMSAILKEDPPELPQGVQSALERIVRRCLEKEPEQRFESVRDLAFALESVSSAESGREKAAGAARDAQTAVNCHSGASGGGASSRGFRCRSQKPSRVVFAISRPDVPPREYPQRRISPTMAKRSSMPLRGTPSRPSCFRRRNRARNHAR